jgi:uncharacterized protein (TIGR01777 family)
MRLFVAGGTGFIGSYLVPYLLEAGHEVRMLLRPRATRRTAIAAGVAPVPGDAMRPGAWWQAVSDCDGAINLTGESITGRWTPARQQRIRESRLVPLGHLVAAIPRDRPFTLISASAVGYFGDAGERLLDERAPPGNDFLARLAREWEARAGRARSPQTRVITTRFGMVLGANGGALEDVAATLRRGLGVVLGRGTQWVSWIHEEDLARAILWLLETPDAQGPANLCSPHPVRQGDLVRTLARRLQCRVGLPVPATAVRMMLGGFADVLLASQRMTPKVLLEGGFQFRYPTLEGALGEILARQGRSARR